ncbi:alkaline phosphatase [Marinihelvus fidelis]|uniref:Alkaline phosphatase n=1 Tax=Marinihelvus fidelis TaxID=2613842 RepID=A0A5N0T9Q1_9GAMM|nr:choice-of-anchor I family protein [Marinihelvus fidelis]KAA9131458.1 alkaline phosphatase [Marinihelvus fidelis]
MLKHTVLAVAIMAAVTNAEAAKEKNITLAPLGTYETGIFDDGAAEIVAHDPATQRLFVINAGENAVDVLDIADPTNPTKLFDIDVSAALPESGGVNSVAVRDGLVAIAVENDDKQANGWAAFYNTDGEFLSAVGAGALPDAITFSPNGRYAVIANEGEPSSDYQVDPEGSITVVDLSGGPLAASVAQATFTAFNDQPLPAGLRAARPFGATLAQDLEPEFSAVSHDSKTAWVSLQENSGIAVVDLASATVTAILGLGLKNHSIPGYGLDASNEDDAINITQWPVHGAFMPDSIASFRVKGKSYLLTANEGDGREYIFDIEEDNEEDEAYCEDLIDQAGTFNDGEADDDECIVYLDEIRVKDVDLDPAAFPNADWLQEDENLGRIKVVGTEGDTDGDGDYDHLVSYGARSISIWSTDGELVWDSGDTIEQVTALADADNFNSTNDENDTFDDRSDDKGPEPETAIVGKAFGRDYAFVGLERVGGIMIFDVSMPEDARYVDYINTRDFNAENDEEEETLEGVDAGDLGPEGLAFIKAEDSPTGTPLLVVGFEISGTTTIFEVLKD